jgi:hypothetical protein
MLTFRIHIWSEFWFKVANNRRAALIRFFLTDAQRAPNLKNNLQRSWHYWATPQCLDSFHDKLSYSLILLIGLHFFFLYPENHSGRLAAMGCVWPFIIVELDPFGDAGAGLWSSFQSVQVNAFVFLWPPEPLHEDVAKEPPFSIHWYPRAGSAQTVSSGELREL